MSRAIVLSTLFLLSSVHAEERYYCAGFPSPPSGAVAKPAVRKIKPEGRIKILVVFGKFRDEYPDQDTPPAWAQDLFDPQRPGSITHFYNTLSRGKLTVEAVVAPGYYEVSEHSSHYVAEKSTVRGKYAEFSHEVLRQADDDVDFTGFTNNGPDGTPNSRDDDRYADAVFIVLERVPRNFLVGPATGIAS